MIPNLRITFHKNKKIVLEEKWRFPEQMKMF